MVARLTTNVKTSIIANYSLMNFADSNRSLYFVSDLRIIWINTAELKPTDETLKQGRDLDHGLLDSPLL
jgi:hypothetical protein